MSTLDTTAKDFDLHSKYEDAAGRIYLTGLQALVRVIADRIRTDHRAGLRTRGFISGYPGSPLGAFDLELHRQAELLGGLGVVHQPGLNEELGVTAVMGSQTAMRFGKLQCDGVAGFWYGKSPGVDRAADAIRHANYFGATRTGGVLAFVGDDPTCKSSSLPNNSEGQLAELQLPTLHPGSIQEVLDFGLHGIALSRVSGLWTGFKVTNSIADGSGTAVVDPERLTCLEPIGVDGRPLGKDEPSTLSPLQILQVEREIYEVRLPAALEYARLNGLNQITGARREAWLGIIAPGHLHYDVVEALRQLGLGEDEIKRRGIRLLRLGMVFPVDEEVIKEFARGLDEIVVVEEKGARLEYAVRNALYGSADAPKVLGKQDMRGRPFLPAHGGLDPDVMTDPLLSRLRTRIDESALRVRPHDPVRINLPLIPRTPYFCSGCPHNSSLRVPDGSLVGAGIGCHSMVAFMSPTFAGEITGVTQMGGEGAQWIGAAPFVDTGHFFQNLGDGTFFHSGEMAIRASVAAGTTVTYKILYNRAVAMTGGQDANGGLEVPQLAEMMNVIGVKKTVITTEDMSRYKGVRLPRGVRVLPRERIVEAQEELRDTPGVTVLIHDQQCAAEARRLRKRGRQPEPARRVVINERVCEGCGDCGAKSNCLSVRPIETEFGAKTTIDQSSCNKDYSCLNGDCPSFVAVEPAGWLGQKLHQRRAGTSAGRAAGVSAPDIEATELPEPVSRVDPADFRVRMPGIGGTGVVTVAQILGTAALLDGRYVTGMDQTGLAQKGGAVVSDLRITDRPTNASPKLPAGAVDLYLAFDLVVAMAPANLAGLATDRTAVVASTTSTPTGRMIGTDAHQPELREFLAEFEQRSKADLNVYLDLAELAEGLFGRTTSANLLGLGVAYQQGLLPVSAEALERAIELNGVAVRMNLQAFRWGRCYVADRERVEQALAAGGVAPAPSTQPAGGSSLDGLAESGLGGEVGRLVAVRAPDLAGYQNAGYAKQYLDLVRRVAAAEERVLPGSTELAEAAARGLHKFMAYKDEYEVARLHLEQAAREKIKSVSEGKPVRVSWYLHPPVLRALGMQRKIKLGPWFTPVFRGLRGMRGVRGTRLDVFGYAGLRRTERELVENYRTLLEQLSTDLAVENHSVAVKIAMLPEMVKGYEDIKMRSIEAYRAHRDKLLGEFNAHTPGRSAPGAG
ncbi:indolepyruvate ferredoxin oxidoreductase family protein [Actinomadura sp. LD22]|uniref:Indolepyruvate ferredoxin oxidoreductase family protein n=1 Tax=Actinomadura physcomitrii TaxID=2650748 RepID=A0A6I4MPT9_9ACTN|nr:indolepyruvate ferredoxin oxidoreductase family protein [Actinomadura physcomitrii]MWA04829.1 indolepyruvate ferredoxin oxidoreductase family protein [Actinomadura physcomitrii]